jgi:hypothetical protein
LQLDNATECQVRTFCRTRRDVTFHEDAALMTMGNMGKVTAFINTLVIALTRQANF